MPGRNHRNPQEPGIPTRLMVALHYLKYTLDLSDEQVVRGWVENPYWQYLSGEKFFQHELPIDPSSMTRWRQRIGEAGAEELLKETIQAGLRLKLIKPAQLKRVNVDTTVQEKNLRFPTDARLYDRARERLVAQAQAEGIPLRQTYVRVGKHLLKQSSRYAHAKQFKRAKRTTKKLRGYLGRVIRDIERKAGNPSEQMTELLATSKRIHLQERKDKNKVYSVHEPDVECISKGKAHKRYEFGCKVSITAASKGGWVVGAKAFHGNPYDGHTLPASIEQTQRITGQEPEQAYADMGYRGHKYQGECQVHVDKPRRGKIPKSTWKWMKRRSAIEPSIGHMKASKRLDRNRLKGKEGDCINVILSAAGMNIHKILKALSETQGFLAQIIRWLLGLDKPPATAYRLAPTART
jgi:IS5 family transposase